MNYLNFYQVRDIFKPKFQNKYTLSIITQLLLNTTNTDCQVNYGCNLKWKLTDKHKYILATGANYLAKQVSKPLV